MTAETIDSKNGSYRMNYDDRRTQYIGPYDDFDHGDLAGVSQQDLCRHVIKTRPIKGGLRSGFVDAISMRGIFRAIWGLSSDEKGEMNRALGRVISRNDDIAAAIFNDIREQKSKPD